MISTKKAKDHCGYNPKPILPTCGNCAAFRSDMVLSAWMIERNANCSGVFCGNDGELYTVEKNGVEKNLRCEDHGFAVKKMASCRLWKAVKS